MQERSILMIGVNHWTTPLQVGDHHLARQFVREGWRVAFLSAPVSPLHLLRGRSELLGQRQDIIRQGGMWDLDGRLWTYIPFTLLAPTNKPLLRSRWLYRNWQRLTWPSALHAVRRAGFGTPDMIYVRDARQSFWLDVLPHKFSMARLSDYDPGLAAMGDYDAGVNALMEELIGRVDLMTYTSKTLLEFIRKHGAKRTLYLPNGVDFAAFGTHPGPVPPEYEALKGPIAVYVGALDMRFDYEALEYAARRMPDVNFVLIGKAPPGCPVEHLPNVQLLGFRPYETVPSYLHHADVGLVALNVKGMPDYINAVSSNKIYQYLACGLPVVSTSYEEVRASAVPVALFETPEEFVNVLQQTLKRKHDRDGFVMYARAQDWSTRYAMLSEVFDPVIGGGNINAVVPGHPMVTL
jgi:glycosyltransferase involved in cell wall biosynthesis